MNKSDKIWRAIELLLACLFIYASLPKIIATQEFALAISRYQLIPDLAINPMAIILPWIELNAALSLIFIRSYRLAALHILWTLLVIFSLALLITMIQGKTLSCGCFGEQGLFSQPPWALGRNLGLLVFTTKAIFRRQSQEISPNADKLEQDRRPTVSH